MKANLDNLTILQIEYNKYEPNSESEFEIADTYVIDKKVGNTISIIYKRKVSTVEKENFEMQVSVQTDFSCEKEKDFEKFDDKNIKELSLPAYSAISHIISSITMIDRVVPMITPPGYMDGE